MADDGDPYTAMEHHWDESFGYFGAARDYNTGYQMIQIVNLIPIMIQMVMGLLISNLNIIWVGLSPQLKEM